jgi:hypothetical protein
LVAALVIAQLNCNGVDIHRAAQLANYADHRR